MGDEFGSAIIGYIKHFLLSNNLAAYTWGNHIYAQGQSLHNLSAKIFFVWNLLWYSTWWFFLFKLYKLHTVKAFQPTIADWCLNKVHVLSKFSVSISLTVSVIFIKTHGIKTAVWKWHQWCECVQRGQSGSQSIATLIRTVIIDHQKIVQYRQSERVCYRVDYIKSVCVKVLMRFKSNVC